MIFLVTVVGGGVVTAAYYPFFQSDRYVKLWLSVSFQKAFLWGTTNQKIGKSICKTTCALLNWGEKQMSFQNVFKDTEATFYGFLCYHSKIILRVSSRKLSKYVHS